MSQLGCAALILGTAAPLPMRLMSVRPLGRLMARMQPPSPSKVDQVFSMMNESLYEWPELRDLAVVYERLPAHNPTWIQLMHSALRLRGTRPEVALEAEELRRISQPTQLIWGEEDPFGPPSVGERAANLIQNAELRVVAGCGHLPWLSRPDDIAGSVAPFLQAHSVDRSNQ